MPVQSRHISGWTRRTAVRAGALTCLGLTSTRLAELRAATPTGTASPARSCVFVFLFGGPSHIDLWDLKPKAPAEIRGEFSPIATATPGLDLCEHLPQLARETDKLCLVRSMTHRMPVHGPACSEMYSGRPYFGPPVTDQATPQDWPSIASLVQRYGEPRPGLPHSVVLPWYSQFVGQDKRIAGQTGGRMGEQFNPFLVQGDPTTPGFGVGGLALAQDEFASERLAARRTLRERLAGAQRDQFASRASDLLTRQYEQAFGMVEAGRAAEAFRLDAEPVALRDRYGRTKFGQSLVAARRLVEAGVSLVTVNWDDGSGADKVSPHWDTHHLNFPKLKQNLAPPFDQAFSAFLADLSQRGLLESTLVVVTGEFGRTPKIGVVTQNGMTEKTGRDHWPHAFTVLLAGGGVRGGQVYGATTSTGGYVADSPVTPADLSATILTHLGVNPHLTYDDQFQQMKQPLTEGRVIEGLT
jgi:hypothetical protein